MFGLSLNWTCTKCKTKMHDDLSFVRTFEVNGADDFVKRRCSNCNTVHYVNTITNGVIVDSNEILVEETGVCSF